MTALRLPPDRSLLALLSLAQAIDCVLMPDSRALAISRDETSATIGSCWTVCKATSRILRQGFVRARGY
jgi:hypothetical protein